MRKFTVVYTNQPGLNRTFKVRGICKVDVLNPCWDDRPTDVPGQHWGGPEIPACPACTKAAFAKVPPAAAMQRFKIIDKGA